MRRLTALLLATLGLLAVAAPTASAASHKDQVVITGRVDVARGETTDTVVLVDGPVNVARGGTVDGDVVAAAGDVHVAGTVTGDVVTFGGRLYVLPGGVVTGDARYGDEKPVIAPGGHVGGKVDKTNFEAQVRIGGVIAWLAVWAALSVSMLLLGLLALWLAPRAADAVAERAPRSWGAVIGIGFGLVIGLPLLAVLASITVLGLPFGIGLLLALLPLFALGYAAAMWLLGRHIIEGPGRRVLSFASGWAILSILALIPALGVLTTVIAIAVGLGALAVTLWSARSAGSTATPSPTGGPEAPTTTAV